ncbi:MAG: transcriptional regulator, partial [Thermoleophilia bacterium]|nr:transcriptional regulator [Thermoleophilia bacterium]
MLHGLYWLCINLSGRGPLALVVDDLHWCDAPSLRFLAYLARRLEGLPVLVVASLRPAEPGADAALLAELTHHPAAVLLHPGPLSPGATTALIEDRLGVPAEAGFARACHGATGGNPLLLNEVLAAMRGAGMTPEEVHADAVREMAPRAVARAVLARLARVAPGSVAVARAVAVLG